MENLGGYQLLETLAKGGMGAVYRAHDPNLGRDVALKIIKSGALANEAERRRFQREGEALAQLRHPTSWACTPRGSTAASRT